MPEIAIQTAGGTRERYPLAKDRVSIGRSRESDIFLPDQWLSRHHAAIEQRDECLLGQRPQQQERHAAERRAGARLEAPAAG